MGKVIPAFGRWTEKDPGFKVSLSYIVSLRPAWVTGDSVSKKQKQQQQQKNQQQQKTNNTSKKKGKRGRAYSNAEHT